jgi:hypothetical protein
MNKPHDNPNFKPLTRESLSILEKRHVSPRQERAFSRLSLMSEWEEEEGADVGKVYDSDLLSGKSLPENLGPFPKNLYGKPIQELDAVRQDERVSTLTQK